MVALACPVLATDPLNGQIMRRNRNHKPSKKLLGRRIRQDTQTQNQTGSTKFNPKGLS